MEEYYFDLMVGSERLGTLSWIEESEEAAKLAIKRLMGRRFDKADLVLMRLERIDD